MAVTKVQEAGNNSTAASSLVVTLGANATAGNLLVCCGGGLINVNITAVSGGGGTWYLARSGNAQTLHNDIWFAYAVTGGSAAITVTFASSSAVAATVVEFSGLLGSVERINGASGTTGPFTGSVVPAIGNETLLVASVTWLASTTTTTSINNGFTALTDQVPGTSFRLASAWVVQAGSASINATWTTSVATTNYVGNIAAFAPKQPFVNVPPPLVAQ